MHYSFENLQLLLGKYFLFCFQNQYEGNQWGRPGPGGPYWRERTLTGQGFFEKMVNNYYTIYKQQTLEA